jgi:membrane-associated phospholipid phosphatase
VKAECPCARDHVPWFDRSALGRSSSGAQLVSNLGVAGLLVVPPLLDTIDVRLHGGAWNTAAEDLVVIGEAVVVNGAMNELVKLAVRRPRPLAYDAAPGASVLSQPDSYLSFYSSHSSTAFAAGMAYASTFARRHPRGRARFVVYGVSIAAAGTVGTMRVLAGKHFPSDVLVGAVVGSAIGVGVPYFHARREVSVSLWPGGLAIRGAF